MPTDTSTERSAFPVRRELKAPKSRYLVGVQGLRTVAAVLVAVYHIWFGRVSGGVDVFFVVAGFFAVGSLSRAFARDTTVQGSLRVGANYLVKTLRRIVPSAAVVILATIVMSMIWMPSAYWNDNLGDARASLYFGENWRLVARGADYLQQDLAASPFQQFWALGVNAQFYLMIAVVLTAAAVIARRIGLSEKGFRRLLLAILTTVLIASFVFSVVFTIQNQPAAYFNTFARLWEFMVGSLAYLLIREGISNKAVASAVGWIGLCVLLGLGAVVDLSRLLPGYLSAIPVLAALAMIISSWNGDEPIVLKWRPVLVIADSSFALYLWHWPLLALYRYQFGYDVPFLAGVGIIAISLVLAVATTKLIEDPIRKWGVLVRSNWRSILVCLVLMIPPVAALVYWEQQTDVLREEPANETVNIGDANGIETEVTEPNDLIPRPAAARDDTVRGYDIGCHQSSKNPDVISCEVGDPGGSKTIALVGGSHSLQWMEVLEEAALENKAKLVVSTKSGCLFADWELVDMDVDESCPEWNEQVIQNLLEMKPDLVVTIATRNIDGVEQIPEGYRKRFTQLADAGIPVLALRDNPWFDFDPPACVETAEFSECSIAADDFYSPIEELDLPADPGFYFVDLEPYLCEDGICPVVQGNILVYRDYNHLTKTWTLKNASVVEDAIAQILNDAD